MARVPDSAGATHGFWGKERAVVALRLSVTLFTNTG